LAAHLARKKLFKMAILRFCISPPEPCIFAIFKPTNFKFWILIEIYITTNDTSGFFDSAQILDPKSHLFFQPTKISETQSYKICRSTEISNSDSSCFIKIVKLWTPSLLTGFDERLIIFPIKILKFVKISKNSWKLLKIPEYPLKFT
jgi:hypothetical protein